MDCDLPASSSAANKTLSYIFDSLLNLIPSVEIGVGAGFDVKIEVVDYDRTNSTEFIVTSWALPTKCLAYDDKASTFAPAVVPTIASLTGNIGGDNGEGDNNGGKGGSLVSPFSASSPRRTSVIAGTVIGVVLGILLLGALSWFLRWHSQQSRATSAESTELLGIRPGMSHSSSAQPPEPGVETAAETHYYYYKDYKSKGGPVVEVRDQATDMEE